MSKNYYFLAVYLFSFLSFSQTSQKIGVIKRNETGRISSVKFPDSIPKEKLLASSQDFFNKYLSLKVEDNLILDNKSSQNSDDLHYNQFYKGIPVIGGGYNVHFNNGKINFANGNFITVENLNTVPSINRQQAIQSYLEYFKIPDSENKDVIVDLIIKQIPVDGSDQHISALVYSVWLKSLTYTDQAFIDAHSGEVLHIESLLSHATATFYTRYNGVRQVETDPVVGGYRLYDDTRNAEIHTQTLSNSSNITASSELVDNDNIWTSSEYSSSNDDMALDIQWGLGAIYDHLYNSYGINSFDNYGKEIDALIKYAQFGNKDNAYWHRGYEKLLFGEGQSLVFPMSSIDVVSHEYGHGITFYQIGWEATNHYSAFNEGLSDIWAAILENSINSIDPWNLGDQVSRTHSQLRNLQNTTDANSYQQTSDTYLSSFYNSTSDPYVRGGVFSHWFYILVEGEIGINSLGRSYSVNGIGWQNAEDIIVKAVFHNYLDNTTSYPEIRDAMIAAAESLFCEDTPEVIAVRDAWYAVGVGRKTVAPKITGSTVICTTSQYAVDLNTNETVSWTSSPSNALNVSSSGSVANVNVNAGYLGPITISATITNQCGTNRTVQKDIYSGKPEMYPQGLVSEGDPTNPFFLCQTYEWEDRNWIYLYAHGSQSSSNYEYDPISGTNVQYSLQGNLLKIKPTSIGTISFRARVSNDCGWSDWKTYTYQVDDCSGGGGPFFATYPNPTSDSFTVVENTDTTSEKSSTEKSLSSKPEKDENLEIEIYDIHGIQKLKIKKKLKESIPVDKLKKGVYVLKIIGLEKSETHQLIVN